MYEYQLTKKETFFSLTLILNNIYNSQKDLRINKNTEKYHILSYRSRSNRI